LRGDGRGGVWNRRRPDRACSDGRWPDGAPHYQSAAPPLTVEDILSRHSIQVVDLLTLDIEGSRMRPAGGPAWLAAIGSQNREWFITECGDQSQLLQKLGREGFQGWLVDTEGVPSIESSTGSARLRGHTGAAAVVGFGSPDTPPSAWSRPSGQPCGEGDCLAACERRVHPMSPPGRCELGLVPTPASRTRARPPARH